jgi:hypothetical protein
MTVIGPNWTGNADSTNSLHGRSLHVRRNSGISVYNSIFTGHKVAGFLLDGRKTAANYCTDTIGFCGNLLVQEPVGKYYALANNTDTLCVLSATVLATLAQADGNDTLTTTTALMLANAFGNTNSNPDLRPNTGSPALTNGSCWAWNSTFLGIEDNNNAPAADDLTIYPNPASDIVTVSLNANAKADAKITLVDLTGKVVAILPVNQISNGANVFTFDVSNLSSGIYMLNIQSAAFSKVEKLIVR